MPSASDRSKVSITIAGVPLSESGASLVVFGVGLLLTSAAAVLVHLRGEERAQREFESHATALSDSLERSFDTPLESLHAISAQRVARPDVTRDEFARFAAALLSRHDSLAALEWAEFVSDPDRAAFEARQTGLVGHAFQIREPGERSQMVPARRRDRYAPLVLMEPYLPQLEGLDICFVPARCVPVDLAARSGHEVATEKFRLVEDPPGVYSVFVYDPVSIRATPTAREFTGVNIAIYRVDPLVRRALGDADLRQLDFALLDDDATAPENRVLFTSRPGAEEPFDAHFVFRKSIRFVGRRWSAVLATHVAPRRLTTWLSALAGVILSALAALYHSATRNRRRLEAALLAERQLGEYTLVKELGSGGMGAVFEATHRLLRRRVAIKLIAPERRSEQLVERFAREARTLSELQHPNTVTLYDYGVAQDGRLYLVMERLDGLTFETVIERYGAQEPARVRQLLIQVCDALAEAHGKGVVHRDIKPANLMLCRFGGKHDFVKVLDFGLARSTRGDESTLSTPGAPLGTFRYMAPECLLDASNATPRSDLYALGCVAYELLSGRPVFDTSDQAALISAHLTRVAPPLDVDRVGAGWVKIVTKCLEKQPESRFQSAAQLAHALSQLDLQQRWTEVEAAEWWSEHGTPDHTASEHEDLMGPRTTRFRRA